MQEKPVFLHLYSRGVQEPPHNKALGFAAGVRLHVFSNSPPSGAPKHLLMLIKGVLFTLPATILVLVMFLFHAVLAVGDRSPRRTPSWSKCLVFFSRFFHLNTYPVRLASVFHFFHFFSF